MTDKETMLQIIKLGCRMRVEQKEYFKTRSRTALAKSKELEKEFDRRVRNLLSPELTLPY